MIIYIIIIPMKYNLILNDKFITCNYVCMVVSTFNFLIFHLVVDNLLNAH